MGDIIKAAEPSGALAETEESQAQQYLTFYLQQEMFGLNIAPIKEIIEYGKITSVPMVPEYVRGVINLRGNVVPVIDLPVRFGWQASAPGKRTCIVIVEVQNAGERLEIGIVIDSVSEVLDIDAACIGAAPSFGARVRTDFIAGMARVGEDFIILLNVNRVLSVEELSRLGDVPRQAGRDEEAGAH